MEKVVNLSNSVNENLCLGNRKSLNLEGIVEILASSENNLIVKLKDTTLYISGTGINIQKLDINSGILQAEGSFDCIKYGKSGNIFKRLFK